jgi:putative nicotinate phosphoribosyltransferase
MTNSNGWQAQAALGQDFSTILRAFVSHRKRPCNARGNHIFGNEPILRVTAPLPEAQLIETRLINILHFQSLIAAKAARLVLLAPNKLLVDFGLRRAHGADAGLMAARASYIAGFAGTATVLAEKNFGIPIYGTMAHSFVQAFNDEAAAFENFARVRPDNLVLLIDTYDTEAAARKVVALAPRLKAAGITVRGVRLDSGEPNCTLEKRASHPRCGRPRRCDHLRKRRDRGEDACCVCT